MKIWRILIDKSLILFLSPLVTRTVSVLFTNTSWIAFVTFIEVGMSFYILLKGTASPENVT